MERHNASAQSNIRLTRVVFIKNAAVLTVCGLLLKAVGMAFRIYLSNRVGAEGMGLYQLIFSVYLLCAAFTGAGISTAVTRLVSVALVTGNKEYAALIMRRAAGLSLILGVIACAAVYLAAPFIANGMIGDLRALPAIQLLSFSLPPMALSSCFKGYMLARRKTVPPCLAQLFEQAIRITVAVLLLGYVGQDVRGCAAAVLCADTVAEICSLVLLYCCTRRDFNRLTGGRGRKQGAVKAAEGILRSITAIAAPIIAGRYLSSGLHTLESLIMPLCLISSGMTREGALEQLGLLKGMALPLLLFPCGFLMSVSSLLIPELSEALSLRDAAGIRRKVYRVLRITLAVSLPSAALFAIFADALGSLIYHSTEVGGYIRVLSLIAPAMCLDAVCDGMLKGLGEQKRTLMYGVADSAVRLSLIFLLVPRFGIAGFVAMMTVSNMLCALLNVRLLLRAATPQQSTVVCQKM